MQENDTEYMREKMAEYRKELEPLVRYLPWLEQATEKTASSIYRGNGLDSPNALAVPVYDSTLMSFIKEATASAFMDRNYMYIYTRKSIKSPEDERRLIESADYKSWDVLCGILSNYVLGGRTRAVLWSQGASERIFYLCVSKMLQIVTEWNAERNLK
ncbi:MAG: hypothetical protein IKQ28_06090 [Lachnospiraceae bacterium]|jgi:hypothetical protein|nr:hypothetical protein [Lachnospiraceae bacterium]MBR6302241.1 hypothetical protein [Lachnospiraceae bacterium]MBR6909309.1 hypothetical protein [Lachnospiraceae bacterium]